MERKYLPEFSFYHTSFPFKEPVYHKNGISNYNEFEKYVAKIPPCLYRRCIEWAKRFEENFYEREDGKFIFASEEERARADREYIKLAEELAEEGCEFKISLWW